MKDLIGFMIAIGVMLLFFGWIVLLVWMDHRNKLRLRQMEQQEHFRMLELGLPLQDPALVQTRADAYRHKLIGLIGILVPLGTFLLLFILTAVALSRNDHSGNWAFLSVMWIVGGAVSAIAVKGSLHLLANRSSPKAADNMPPAEPPRPTNPSLGIREKPPGMM